MEKFLSIDEVADYLHVPVQTIRWLRQERRFVPAHKFGRRLLWTQQDLDAWIIQQREPAA